MLPATSASAPAPPPGPPPLAQMLVEGKTAKHAWCTDGTHYLDHATCVVLPERPKGPPRLLIYLHGVIDPESDSQKVVQGIVVEHARRHGLYALLPRGIRGIGPKPIAHWYAWPTSAGAHREHGRSLVERLLRDRDKLETMLGRSFARTYLAGSSNGAYFLSALALSGDIDVDGLAATSGGAPFGRLPQGRRRSTPPFYIGYGQMDDSVPGARDLSGYLARVGWPHRTRIHKTGHGARAVYLDEALAFWEESHTNARNQSPPASIESRDASSMDHQSGPAGSSTSEGGP